MTRKSNTSYQRKIIADVKYNQVLLAKFINYLMLNGKKSSVQTAVYKALDKIKTKTNSDPVKFFEEAIGNATPKIEVRSKRIGGATYQIPMEVPPRRATSLSLKWMKTAIRQSAGRSLTEKVFNGLSDAFNKKGWAVKKREEVFRMAESNKAFAHYRW